MRCGWQEKVIIKHKLLKAVYLLEHKREHVNVWDVCLLFGNSQRFLFLIGYLYLDNIAYWLLMNNITRRQPFAFRKPSNFYLFSGVEAVATVHSIYNLLGQLQRWLEWLILMKRRCGYFLDLLWVYSPYSWNSWTQYTCNTIIEYPYYVQGERLLSSGKN